MAMTYTSLIAAKGTAGSIKNWVNYSLLDIEVILDEAQALIYSILRCREMRASYTFTMGENAVFAALPTRFLDPIGTMRSHSLGGRRFSHKDMGFVQNARSYEETSGTFGADPFTTTSGSTQISVALTAHGFTQGSSVYIAGASAVGGVTPNGTFPIVSVTANAFVIETSDTLSAATSTATGGGSSATYTVQELIAGTPMFWAVFDERIQFDCAFSEQETCSLLYYRSLPLLSSSNTTNFLTNRYPHLLRTACMASAADFMKDKAEYDKLFARMQAFVQSIAVEADLTERGSEVETENP